MPIVPHATVAGVECWGCIVAAVEDSAVELRCTECGAVAGVIQIEILKGLLGLDCPRASCPRCHQTNVFPGFTEVKSYVCYHCHRAFDPEPDSDLDSLGWVVRVLRPPPADSQ